MDGNAEKAMSDNCQLRLATKWLVYESWVVVQFESATHPHPAKYFSLRSK